MNIWDHNLNDTEENNVELETRDVYDQDKKDIIDDYTQRRKDEQGNWASEASPTLGCSIEISRDICIFILYFIFLQ